MDTTLKVLLYGKQSAYKRIRKKEGLSINGKVKFEGIGDFSHESGYLFNVGNLFWKVEDWKKFVINSL